MQHAHPELDVVITQMRSLEASFLSEQFDQPVMARDLLSICEAIRTLAAKVASLTPVEETSALGS